MQWEIAAYLKIFRKEVFFGKKKKSKIVFFQSLIEVQIQSFPQKNITL